MADMLLKEGVTMAANRPSEGDSGTVMYKDKVIDSRITKKAKRKTLSLADILQPTTQNDDGVGGTAGLPTNSNARPKYGTDPSDYRNPSVQQIPEIHPTEAEGLKLLEDILEMSVDEEGPQPTISEDVPTEPQQVLISDRQRRTSARKREFERTPPIQMLHG
jgi:hypothetical protein